MKSSCVFLSLLLIAASPRAEELVRAVSFPDATDSGLSDTGAPDGVQILTIDAAPGTQRYPVIELADPGITSPVYALKGMIRYADVEGDGFLQMDSHFGARGTFFTKSLASSGPLGKISGSADWRPFVLPFFANRGDRQDGSVPTPEGLSLALYLPGPGTVAIRGIELYQYADGEDPLQMSGQWIDARSAALIGAIGGCLIGLWGAALGVVASRGKARGFALGSAFALLIIGITCLSVGVAAIATAQPYAIYYPLLLIGVILVAVFGSLRSRLSARYAELEMKRMQSMDV